MSLSEIRNTKKFMQTSQIGHTVQLPENFQNLTLNVGNTKNHPKYGL